MKFSCERCSTSYVIADDKIGRGLKVRCKKCGNIILIRGQRVGTPSAEPAASDDVTQRVVAPTAAAGEDESPLDSSPGESVTAPGGNSLLSGLSFDDEKTAVYDPSSEMLERAGAEGSSAGGYGDGAGDDDMAPPADEATRVFNVEQMKELAEERELAAAEKRERPAVGMPGFAVQPPRPAADPVWYMAIEGRQVGPLPVDEVRRRIEKGEVDLTTYCWRSGFKDWISLSGVPELERVYNEVRPEAVVSAEVAARAAPAETDGVVSVSARRPMATGRMYGGRTTSDEELFAASAAAAPEPEPDEVAIGTKREEHKPTQRQRKLTAVEFDLSELASMAQEEIEEADKPEEEEEREAAAEVARDLATSDPFAEEAVRVESRSEAAGSAAGGAAAAAEADDEEAAAAGDEEAAAASDEPASVRDLIDEELEDEREEPREVDRVVIGRAQVRQPGEIEERVPDEARSDEAYRRREAPVSMARRETVDRGSLLKVGIFSAIGAILFFVVLLPFGLVIGGKVRVPLYYDLVYGEDERTAETPAKDEGKEPAKDEAKEPAKDEAKEPAKDESKEPAKDEAKEPAKDEAKEPAKDEAKDEVEDENAEPDDSELDEAAKKVAKKEKSGKKLSRAERRELSKARAEARKRRKEEAKARAEERKRKKEEARAERERQQAEKRAAAESASRERDTRRPTPAAASSDEAGDFDDILDEAPNIPKKKTEDAGHRRRGSRGGKTRSAAADPDFDEDDDFEPAPKRRAKKEEPLPPPPKETKKGEPLPDTLDKNTVLSVIKRGLPKIKKCAQEQVSRNKDQVVKKIVLAFTIERNGRCTGVSVGPDKVKGSYLESCVKKTVDSWRYPKFFGENIKVKLPLPVAVR